METTFSADLNEIILTVAREIARAERFLQVIHELLNDERIPVDVRLEYVNKATAANRG